MHRLSTMTQLASVLLVLVILPNFCSLLFVPGFSNTVRTSPESKDNIGSTISAVNYLQVSEPEFNPEQQQSGFESVFASFQENIPGTPTSPNLLVDNSLFKTPVTLQWVNGSQHTIEFLPFFTSSNQSVRYNFSSGIITNATGTVNMTKSQITLTATSNMTFNATYLTQFRLLISGPEGNSSLYYNAGSKVTFSVPNFTLSASPSGSSAYYYVSKAGQVRYRFISVTGVGAGSNSSQTPVKINVTMSGPITELVNSEIEYGLTVIGTPLSLANTTWYNQTQTATFKPILFSQSLNGTMYNVTGWTSSPGPATMNSTAWSFVMNQPVIIMANFSTFYLLSVETAYGHTTGSGWYRPNSTATFSITPTIVGIFPFDLIFTGWSGDFAGGGPSGSIRVTHPSTVIANWTLDYRGPIIITAIPVIAALAYLTRTHVFKKRE
jgi:hypothetical protein